MSNGQHALRPSSRTEKATPMLARRDADVPYPRGAVHLRRMACPLAWSTWCCHSRSRSRQFRSHASRSAERSAIA